MLRQQSRLLSMVVAALCAISAALGTGCDNEPAPPNGLPPVGSPPPSPTFTVVVAPFSQSVRQGGSATYDVTVTSFFGFAGTVSFTVTGLPTGATASFVPPSVTVSGTTTPTTTMTVTTSSMTPSGTSSLIITGTSSGMSAKSPGELFVGNFSLSAMPNSQTVAVGGAADYTVTVTPVSGFSGTVNFSVTGLPTGATASFAPPSVTVSASTAANTTMTVTTSSATPAATSSLTVTGTSSGASSVDSVTLVVTDFGLSANPSSRTVLGGGIATYDVTVTGVNGFAGPVSFTVTGLPTGATASFTPPSVPGGFGTTFLDVMTSATTPSGTSSLTITGTSSGVSRTFSVTLSVGNFSLSAMPSSQPVSVGGAANYTVTVTPLNGFSGTVNFSVTGLPTGATASFAPPSVTVSGYASASATMTVTTSSATPAARRSLTVTGTFSGASSVASVTLVVTDFMLDLSPASQTVPPSGSATYTVNVTAVNGFSGTVSFSPSGVMGLPTGTTASFNPASVTGAGSTMMTVTTSSATPNGTFNSINVTGTSGPTSHTSNNVTLVVGIPGSPCPQGSYVYLFQGFDSATMLSSSVVKAGVFEIDATSAVTGGSEDFNTSAMVNAEPIIGGSCTIVSGNRGILLLSVGPLGGPPLKTTTYHFTANIDLTVPAFPRMLGGELIEFDDTTGTGTRGSGFFEQQGGSSLNLPGLTGEKIISLSGYFGDGVRAAAVGRFTIDPTNCTSSTCSISQAEMDASNFSTAALVLGMSGSFEAPDPVTGRGTATLMVAANPVLPSTMNFTYYIVHAGPGASDNNLFLVQTDHRSVAMPTLGGRVRLQIGFGTFDSTSLGTIVFSTGGVVGGGSTGTGNPSVAAGVMTGTGTAGMPSGTLTGTLDQNAGGTITLNAGFATGGSYTVQPNGRTSFSFTAGGIAKSQVAYLSFPPACVFACTRGSIMDAPGSDVSFGEFVPQGGPFNGLGFTNADLNGTFRVNSKSPTGTMSLNESGQGTLDGIGTMPTSYELTADISGTTGLLSNQMSMGTYSVAANGRVTVSLTTGQSLVFWIVSSSFLTSGHGQFVGISTVTPGDANPVLLEFLQ